MKKIYYFLFVALIPMLLFSCKNEEKDIFDDSAANRMTKSLEEYTKILQSAENGWLMSYYLGGADQSGGINLFCKFDDLGKVTLTSEFEVGEEVTSTYKLIGDQSAVLSFNSYNKIIHQYCEPQNSNYTDGGDYEFKLYEVTPERIVMRGKKRNNEVILTKFNKPKEEWTQYLTEVNEIALTTETYSNYKIVLDGKEISKGNVDPSFERRFRFYDLAADMRDDPATLYETNAIYTPKGISFQHPVDIKGNMVQNFEWDETNLTYICTDPKIDLKLVVFHDPTYMFYEDFIGSYDMQYKNFVKKDTIRPVTVEPLVVGKSYLVKGFLPNNWTLEMQYIRSVGSINLNPQLIGEYGADKYPVHLYGWDGGGSLWATVGPVGAFMGTYNGKPEDPKIEFSKNKMTNTLPNVGFFVIITTPSGYSRLRPDGNSYQNIVFVRKP